MVDQNVNSSVVTFRNKARWERKSVLPTTTNRGRTQPAANAESESLEREKTKSEEAVGLDTYRNGFVRGGRRQAVGFDVAFATDVGDGEFERAGQLSANPVQRVQAFTAAVVVAQHLANDNLRIRINVQPASFQIHCALQGFEQGQVLGNIVVLVTDPFGDSDPARFRAINHDTDASRARIAQGAAIYIRN